MNVTEKFALAYLGAVEAAVDDEREQRRGRSRRAQPVAASARQPRTARRARVRSCSCGARHSVESATNETTSTIAAVQLNSQTGIGRSALPTMPCACGARRDERAPPGAARRRAAPAACDGARRSCAAQSMERRRRGPPPAARPLAYPGACMHAAATRRCSDRRSTGRDPARPAGARRRCSTRAACARSADAGNPVPGWRQACFYAGFVVIGAALTSLGSDSQELLYVHMIEHLLLGDIAALLIVLGLTGPLIAPILKIKLFDRLRVLSHPADRLPAVGDRPVRLAPAGPLPGGAAPHRRARAAARDVPGLRRSTCGCACSARCRCRAGSATSARLDLHRRRAPDGHRARQHLPVVRARSSTPSTCTATRSSTSRRWPTRTSPARS